MSQLLQLGRVPVRLSDSRRFQLQRRARLLAWGGIAWHVVEFGIAVGAELQPARSRSSDSERTA